MRLIDADELLELINPPRPTKRDTSVRNMSVDDVVFLVNSAKTVEALSVENTMKLMGEMFKCYDKWKKLVITDENR